MARPKRTEICPVGGAGLSGTLQTFIWFHLLSGTRRFGELRRLIPQASRQMLTMQLRELERMGVVQRREYEQYPPRVEYSLTSLGLESGPAVRQFVAWGEWFCEQAGLDYDVWLERLGSRWKVWIWYHLFSGPKRFGELQRLLPLMSRQGLAVELRELEQMRVLTRRASTDGPLKVDYALTDLGRQSEAILPQLFEWGRWFCDQTGVTFDWPVRDVSSRPALAAAPAQPAAS